MQYLGQIWVGHGYWVLFMTVLLDGLGVPLTAIPLIAIAGGLAAAGKMSFCAVVILTTLAAGLGDVLWYILGRSGGPNVRRLLSRALGKKKDSLNRGIGLASKYSFSFLLISKFIPGIASIAPPAAGIVKMPVLKFLLADTAARVLWAASVSWIGYVTVV